MKSHRKRTGERMTYIKLAERTGLSKATLASIGARDSYNASLNTVGKICRALGCTPGELLEIVPESTRKRKSR
jgi:DNA-binding Xre family transcriptional regulator